MQKQQLELGTHRQSFIRLIALIRFLGITTLLPHPQYLLKIVVDLEICNHF